MTFTYLLNYVRAQINKDRTVCESKRMIQAAFTGCKLKLDRRRALIFSLRISAILCASAVNDLHRRGAEERRDTQRKPEIIDAYMAL